jgi:hypothetical protein
MSEVVGLPNNSYKTITNAGLVFNATFSNISTLMATTFSGGRSWGTWRDQPTMGKQLVSFITCGCESSARLLLNQHIELKIKQITPSYTIVQKTIKLLYE